MTADGGIFLRDRPRRKPDDDDLLYYAPRAERLADQIARMRAPGGYVIAINGEWGLGKSTLLEFTRYYLERKPWAERPDIVEFNPWWFSGREDLTRHLLRELLVCADRSSSATPEVRRLAASFAELLSDFPGLKPLRKPAGWLRNYGESLSDLKSRLGRVLEQNGRPIVVIMDDIDRLMTDEILELFRLIKGVADFPNVLYLLAFDRNVVVKALNCAGLDGSAYLDKIVQDSRDLAAPDRLALRAMLELRLEKALGSRVRPSDSDRLFRLLHEGVYRLIRTPRHVVRLCNSLRLSYPSVEGEVNIHDFIALETLRLLRYEVYRHIANNSLRFAGIPQREDAEEDDFHSKAFKKWNADHDREALIHILSSLFPRFAAAMNRSFDDNSAQWNREMRICHPNRITVYFRQVIPIGAISNAELEFAVQLSEERSSFAEYLLELSRQFRPDGLTRVAELLEVLGDDAVSANPRFDAEKLLLGLFEGGDAPLVAEDRSGLFEVDNRGRQGRLVHQLLKRLEMPARKAVLKEGISRGEALGTIVDTVAHLGDLHGKYSGKVAQREEILLEMPEVEKLEQMALRRIREAANRKTLLETPELVRILYQWGDWGEKDEVNQYLQDALANEKEMLLFLRQRIPDRFFVGKTNPIHTLQSSKHPQALRDFVEPADFKPVIERLAQRDDLSETDKVRVRFMMSEIERGESKTTPDS